MATKLSTGLQSAMLTNSGLLSLMNGGRIYVYSGSPPASADAAATGTYLAEVNPVSMALIAPGLIDVTEGHTLEGRANGTAGWFRWSWADVDSGTESVYYPRIDGSVGVDLILESTAITTETSENVQMIRLRFNQ